MTQKKNLFLAWMVGGAIFLCCACGQDNSRNLDTRKVQWKNSKQLAADKKSPTCEIDIIIEKAVSPEDVAQKVNERLVSQIFGYDSLDVEVAIDSFANEQNRLYSQECTGYAARPDTDKEWYQHRHYVRAEEKSTYPNIITYETLVENKKGTSRKSSLRTYLNFDARNGERINAADMFKPGYEHVIEPLLMRELQKKFNCVSLAQLNAKGILCNSRLYVPDNFRPGKNEIKFLFNESEIAPYKTGEITLSISRSLLEQVIKFK